MSNTPVMNQPQSNTQHPSEQNQTPSQRNQPIEHNISQMQPKELFWRNALPPDIIKILENTDEDTRRFIEQEILWAHDRPKFLEALRNGLEPENAQPHLFLDDKNQQIIFNMLAPDKETSIESEKDELTLNSPNVQQMSREDIHTLSPEGKHKFKKIRMTEYNAQKSWQNLDLYLTSNNNIDIHIITEPPWRTVKNVASGKSAKGIPYENTVGNHQYICLGMHKDARVCIYVRRDLQHMQPRLYPLRNKTNDIAVLVIKPDHDKELMIAGVYNDPDHHEAQKIMIENVDILQHAAIITGDINLHHEKWDAHTKQGFRQPKHKRTTEEFIQLIEGELDMKIINMTEQPDTWHSNDLTKMTSTVDLLCATKDTKIENFEVRYDQSKFSDHSPIWWDVVIDHTFTMKKTIKQGSKAGEKFIRSARHLIGQLPTQYENKDQVENVTTALFNGLHDLWDRIATYPNFHRDSKSWWNENCMTINRQIVQRKKDIKALRTQVQHLRRNTTDNPIDTAYKLKECHQKVTKLVTEQLEGCRALTKASRLAKKEYYDYQIQKLHDSRIWDVVSWTKERKQQAENMIKKPDGSLVTNPDELANTLKNQFTPSTRLIVTEETIHEMPQEPTRKLVPFSSFMVYEAIQSTSNFSALGPDRLS